MREIRGNIIQRTNAWLRRLLDKKQYIEFLTATLSIPVLLTVIVLNLNSLRNINKTPEEKKEAPVQQIIYVTPKGGGDKIIVSATPAPSPTVGEACNKDMPSVEIRNPSEGDTVTTNPVNIIIAQEKGDFCAVVWSHRINNGAWSEYDDKSIALYNLPKGKITFDLRVKSIVTGEELLLKRTFEYDGPASDTTSKTSSSSAS